MTAQDLAKYFTGLIVPPKLLALLKFEHEFANNQFYAEGFEFCLSPEKRALRTWSEAPNFLASLWTFALADHTGSLYAFWLPDNEVDLGAVPIAVFGSEGGAHVVARNFDDFLQILSFDCEPMVDYKEVYYYRTKGAQASPMSANFHDWLRSECKLDVVEDADRLVVSAQESFGERFLEWMAKFAPTDTPQ